MGTPAPSRTIDLIRSITGIQKARTIHELRRRASRLKAMLDLHSGEHIRLGKNGQSGSPPAIPRSFLVNELRQIKETRTVNRARYYAKRLSKALTAVRPGRLNDINLNRWKEYDGILTDSLWVLSKRDSSGPHSAWYWGNFIPQIPHQLMLRYTKKGEWVLDPFVGSGTTLLECQRLGRHGIGVELQPSVVRKTRAILRQTARRNGTTTAALEIGDSTRVDFRDLLRKHGAASVQLAILHPPYHDIIAFSRSRTDLSNAKTSVEFAERFGRVVDRVTDVLDRGRMMAVVIGDKYEKGQWIPLGFLLMNEVLKRRYKLKSIVVKNFEETLGKRSQKELWRYRALAGGFYVFKHEYIFIFQKNA